MIIDTDKVAKAIKYNTAYFLSQHIDMTRNNIGFYKRGEKDLIRLNLKSAIEIQSFYDKYMTIKTFYLVRKEEVLELFYTREIMRYKVNEVPIKAFHHDDYTDAQKLHSKEELDQLIADLEDEGLERGVVDEGMIRMMREEKEK